MGIILWEMLTGRRLFKTESEAATLQRVVSDPIPRLSSVLPDLHAAIDDACARALERDPLRRYQSAAEMADALERAARESAAVSPTDLGVASPREVAGYVQSALGQDIAAQRESVRAWLSQSEPSAPAVRLPVKPTYDVTMKVPLDRQSATPAPPAIAPSAETRKLIPAGTAAPIEPRAAQGGVMGVPIDARVAMTPPPPVAGQPPMDGFTPPGQIASGLASEEYDPDAEGETQLMVRGGPSRPPGAPRHVDREIYGRPSGDYQDPTPIAATAVNRRATVPSRAPQIIAVIVGLLLAGAGFALWSNLRETPTPEPGASSAHAPGTASPSASSAAPAPPPPPPTATASAPPASAPVETAPPREPPPSVPGPLQKKAPTSSPKPTAPAPEPPKTSAPPPPPPPKPPPGGDDLANPYR
jgi:hypothetical protein